MFNALRRYLIELEEGREFKWDTCIVEFRNIYIAKKNKK